MSLSVKFICPECDKEHTFEVIPACPPVPCQDHDSPNFSDPGSDAEVNGPEECDHCGKQLDQYFSQIEQQAYDENPPNDYDGPETRGDMDPEDYNDEYRYGDYNSIDRDND